MALEFTVIDNRTGKHPDCETIALTEEWAKHLIYCDIDCFAITEEGQLILIDDCNNIAYPPADRFTVTIAPESLKTHSFWESYQTSTFIGYDENHEPRWAARKFYRCERCRKGTAIQANYCPNCGAKMNKED